MNNKITWEDAVRWLRSDAGNPQIAIDAYLEEDLVKNVERFRISEEFIQVKKILADIGSNSENTILDIGAGNGISSIAFALEGFRVVALEPDPSQTVGSGAIRYLIDKYKLKHVEVIEAFGESLPFDDKTFDIVYGRQVMHHAHNLEKFISETARVLKNGGILLTARDHVVESQAEKEQFLKRHPLHHLYGGENAFSQKEYTNAIEKAGFKIMQMIKPSESAINLEPWSKQKMKEILISKIGTTISQSDTVLSIAWYLMKKRLDKIPGRLYTFVATKK